MRISKFNLLAVLVLGLTLTFTTSCDDDPDDTNISDGCGADSYQGTFVGKHWLLNLVELSNNDTIVITTNGDTLSITSALLNSTFTGLYDTINDFATVSNLNFPQFIIGNDTLFDITVSSGKVQLDFQCNNLFVNLDGVSVNDGTVTLPAIIGDYPLTNVSMNTRNGLARQQ